MKPTKTRKAPKESIESDVNTSAAYDHMDGFYPLPGDNKFTKKPTSSVSIKVEYQISQLQTIHVGIDRPLEQGEDVHEAHSELYINCLETISVITNDLVMNQEQSTSTVKNT